MHKLNAACVVYKNMDCYVNTYNFWHLYTSPAKYRNINKF